MDRVTTGERIKYMRELNGYTRESFAEKTGISSKFLYEIEMGKKGFSAEVLLRISRTLEVNCDYIMTGEPVINRNTEQVAAILENIDERQMGRVKEILRLIQEISSGRGRKG